MQGNTLESASRSQEVQLLSPEPAQTSKKPSASLRVTVVQPSLAKYRIPVFRELASREGLDVRVEYGTLDELENVPPAGFQAFPSRLRKLTIAGRSLMLQPAQWRNASRRRNDVVVLQWSARYMATLVPALLRARMSGVATVLWGHGYSKLGGPLQQKLHRWIARLATVLLFYEPRTRDRYVQAGGDPSRLFVALNSLGHQEIVEARDWWLAHPGELDQFRREHGLDGGPVILFVSRLQPANRVDLLIEATAALLQDVPNVRTVIIGNGEAERKRLEERAERAGIRHAVTFQKGIYDEKQLAPWFLSADVFCYPANVGLSLIHALWYGLPVVTSDNLAIQNPEIVALEHGVNGLTYEDGSAAALAGALRELIGDDAKRLAFSAAARRTVEQRFTVTTMVDGMEAAIRAAAERNGTKRNGQQQQVPCHGLPGDVRANRLS